ncbi:GNAT family N-acetyltransferase [Candidatus Fermentibacteria bacterium]|nr:MAG: GNAT family N-acetyltransferase [Candidatus Fermentibacteria bacterium]
MDIVTMKKNDYTELLALWSGFSGNTMTGADSMEDFEKFLCINADYCYSAFENGRLVGSVMAGSDGRRGYIYHLAVDESQQGKGTGRKLMDAAENALRDAGIEKAHLFIYTDNTAIEFYEKTGWHRRSDIAVMSKVLIGDKYMGTRLEE